MSISPITKDTAHSTIYICKSVPFSRDYSHTILFDSYRAQKSYIEKHTKYHCTTAKPFTIDKRIRVPYPAEQMYECNYIYFRSQDSAKWFPAFIDRIERVNENVADIYYDMDVLQSWMFEWRIKPCMVLREHVNDDTPGKNIMPEPVDTGDYVVNATAGTGLFGTDKTIVLYYLGDTINTTLTAGVYCPLSVKTSRVDPVTGFIERDVPDQIKALSEKPENIVSVFMFATKLLGDSIKNDQTPSAIVDVTAQLHYTNIDGYKARNYKLYTYPFNMLYGTDYQGSAATWRYEWFSDANYRFQVACALTPTAQPSIYPLRYAGMDVNCEQGLTMQPFPQCPYAIDSYRAYLAQNSFNIAGTALTTTLGIGASAATAGAGIATANPFMALAGVGGVASGVSSGLNTLQDIRNHEVQPYQAKGAVTSDTLYSMGITDFHLMQKCITKEYAKAIDDYFDVYGYAVNEVKIPNLTGRPKWNYVQTENMQITGEIAFSDIAKLNAIFNRGVTFWHTEDIGNYSLKNK